MKKLKGLSVIPGFESRDFIFSFVKKDAAFYLPYFYRVKSYEEN